MKNTEKKLEKRIVFTFRKTDRLISSTTEPTTTNTDPTTVLTTTSNTSGLNILNR